MAAGATPGTSASVLLDMSQVADDVDVVMAGYREVWLDQHPPRAVERDAKCLRQRRGGDTRRPNDGVSMNAFRPDGDPLLIDSGHLNPCPDGDT